jgi:hypothetical protein
VLSTDSVDRFGAAERPYLFGASHWETTGFAHVSSVETTVYLSRAEKSRVDSNRLGQLVLTTETRT